MLWHTLLQNLGTLLVGNDKISNKSKFPSIPFKSSQSLCGGD